MAWTRWMKLPCLAALSLGLFAMTAWKEIAAASKAEEAKRYAQLLKTTKDPKIKVTALKELGDAAMIDKELVVNSIPDIAAALKDGDANVRGAAAHAYGQAARAAGDKKAVVSALVKILKEDGSEAAKYGAIQGLASMRDGAREAVGDLRKLQQEEVERAKKDPKNAKNNNPQTKLSRAAGDAMRSINDRN